MDIPGKINKIVVDVANVAYQNRTSKKKPDIKNIIILMEWEERIKSEHPEIEFSNIADASLYFRISNGGKYKSLVRKGRIHECPSKMEADQFIMMLLKKYDGEILVISNDLLRDFKSQIDELANRIQYGFMIEFDELLLHPFDFKPEFKGGIAAAST